MKHELTRYVATFRLESQVTMCPSTPLGNLTAGTDGHSNNGANSQHFLRALVPAVTEVSTQPSARR